MRKRKFNEATDRASLIAGIMICVLALASVGLLAYNVFRAFGII